MKQPIAEILSQGDEVITGEIADTNAASRCLATPVSGIVSMIS